MGLGGVLVGDFFYIGMNGEKFKKKFKILFGYKSCNLGGNIFR